jgi:hypothetical protein
MNYPIITFRPEFCRLTINGTTAGVHGGLLLSILFQDTERTGKEWLETPYSSVHTLTGLSQEEASHAFESLLKMGLIERRNIRRTVETRLDVVALQNALAQYQATTGNPKTKSQLKEAILRYIDAKGGHADLVQLAIDFGAHTHEANDTQANPVYIALGEMENPDNTITVAENRIPVLAGASDEGTLTAYLTETGVAVLKALKAGDTPEGDTPEGGA